MMEQGFGAAGARRRHREELRPGSVGFHSRELGTKCEFLDTHLGFEYPHHGLRRRIPGAWFRRTGFHLRGTHQDAFSVEPPDIKRYQCVQHQEPGGSRPGVDEKHPIEITEILYLLEATGTLEGVVCKGHPQFMTVDSDRFSGQTGYVLPTRRDEQKRRKER